MPSTTETTQYRLVFIDRHPAALANNSMIRREVGYPLAPVLHVDRLEAERQANRMNRNRPDGQWLNVYVEPF